MITRHYFIRSYSILENKMAEIIGYLSISGAIKLLWTFVNSKTRPSSAKHVGEVTELHLFPVKSMASIQLKRAECTQRGLKYPGEEVFDRNFMVIDKRGTFVSARAIPKMTTIKTSLSGDNIIMEFKGMPTLCLPAKPTFNSAPVRNAKVWGEHVQGHDCGDEAAEWICTCLSVTEHRLIYCSEGLLCRELNKQTNDIWKLPCKDGDRVTYQDGFPYLLTNEKSLDDVNNRKMGEPFTMNRFRPNIVISGSKAYEEDHWKEIWIGNSKFTNIQPCIRCTMTTVDPKVGVKDKDKEPFATLLKYRLDKSKFGNDPLFGVNLVLDSQDNSCIKEGDPVYVIKENNINL